MDFDAVADELYGVDRDEFISVRERRAEQARNDGDRDLAERIQRLRKPTSAAALINQLARQRPDDIAALIELGDELRRAHAEFAGDRLRTLTRRRNDLVRTLTGRARQLGGDRVSEPVAREVSETLDAASADPETGHRVRAGRLSSAVRPTDVFADTWLPTGPASARDRTDRTTPKPKGRPKQRQPAGDHRERPESPEDTEGPERSDDTEPAPARQDREREWERRRREDQRRREEEVEARKARDKARKELRAAEHEETKARKRTEAARKAFEAADRLVNDKTS